MKRKSYFIAIEGIEGVGKTTLSRIVESHLSKCGYPTEMTREPGGTELAEKVRSLLKDKQYEIDPVTELLLMFSARSHHVTQRIKPLLEKGVSVISDRYVDASYAYQGGGRGIEDTSITQLERLACQGIRPDMVILVTCPVDVAMQRVLSRNEAIDRIEQEKREFFERAQEKYLSIARGNDTYLVIDGSQPLEDVERDLQKHLAELIQ